MKRPLNPKPDHQKWALFVVLTASLGFTLSMNPDHFNNIARHEINGGLHTVDMASTPSQADVRKADNKIDADSKSEESSSAESKSESKASSSSSSTSSSNKTPPGEKDSLPNDMIVSGTNGRSYRVSFTKENQVAKANFKALGNTEGQSCPICDLSIRVQSSLDKADDLALEVKAIAEGKLNAAQSGSKTEEKVGPQKKGEATEVDLAKWAEKCESASDETKLDCHKGRLIELSKYLKNSSETESLVQEYFSTYLQSDLKRALLNPTIRETSIGSCEGQVVYNSSFGRVGCQSDNLDHANEITEEILSGLRAGNSKGVVSAISKMRSASFSAQLRYSQSLANSGKNEGNQAKFWLGMNGMDPTRQTFLLNQMNSNMLDSIQGMQGSSSQKSALENVLENQFYSPVNGMLLSLKNYVLSSNSTTPGQNRSWLDFPISPLPGDDLGSAMVPPNSTNPNYTPGLNIPDALLASRMSAPVRGGSLQQLFGGLTSYPQTNTFSANSLLTPSNFVTPSTYATTAQPNTMGQSVPAPGTPDPRGTVRSR